MDAALRPASQRLQRLREISLELGFAAQDDLPSPQPTRHLLVAPTPAAEQRAEFLLANIRAESSAGQSQRSGLKKAFSTSKRKETSFTSNEIHDAIAKEVCLNGQAEVVEVLHNRLISTGCNPNFSRRVSGNVIKKIKGVEQTNERSRLLQTAVEMQRMDFVRIFAPHADQISLDESLQLALPNRCLEIIEILLEWGADSSTSLAFLLRAAQYGDAEFVGILLQSKNPPTNFSECLLPAAVNGSLRTVSLLMKAGANGDHQEAAALRHAVGTGREDLATVIVMGQKPPSSVSLNTALGSLLGNPAINLHKQLRMTDILLCGGPIGDATNEGLIKATQHSCIPMMKLLLEARASINYRDGAAVQYAVARGRMDLLDVLLQMQPLSPQIASVAMGSIDLKASSDCKISIASKLLSQKATGHHTNELLVHAIETDDVLLAEMLATQGADANHNSARGLVLAVSRLRLDMAEILIRTSPSTFSLCKAFEAIPRGDAENGHSIAQALLKAGAKGNEVDSELLAELSRDEASKDFIGLLVNNGARVSNEMILTTVAKGNYEILHILLGSEISPSVISEAIPLAMKIQHPLSRYRTLKLLLQHPTPGQIGPVEIIQAIVAILKVTPHDVPLLSLLCQDNRADANLDNGQAVILAIGCQDPFIFNTVIKSGAGIIKSQTVAQALTAAMDLPVSEYRHHIIGALLLKARPQESLNQALVQEICLALGSPRDHGVIQALLMAGADVDALDSASVCHAVRDPGIMDLLLLKKPSQQSLARAFPLAMALQVAEERFHMCQKLLRAGVVGEEIDKALCHAAKESSLDIALLQLLAPQADMNFNDGQALRRVIRKNQYDGVKLILSRRPSILTLLRGLREAMNIKAIDARLKIIELVLEAGAKGELVSECLIIAVNQGDLSLCELFVRHGASIEYLGGQGIISAASSGNTEILNLLTNGVLCSKPTLSSVTAGFGAATSLRGRDDAAFYDCAEILLRAGLRGEAVDKALVEAVKEGDSNLKLSKLFIDFGAGVEFQEGEAVDLAVSSASVETLGLLLTAKPSQNVLKRAFRSSLGLAQDERRLVCELVLKAGKTIDKHVTNTLLQATQEIPADRPLIRTLLAAQVYDDGQSVQHAARVLDLETLSLLLESPKAEPYVSSSFGEFAKTEVPWKSKKGPGIVLCFLSHGALGQTVDEALLNATDRVMTSSGEIASQILDSLLQYNADVNYQRGRALQKAAKQGNIVLIRKLLTGAGADARMMAFPYLFLPETSISETDLLHLIGEFTDGADPETNMGVGFRHPDPSVKPVIFMVLEKYPRKSHILRALLDVGFNPFPVTLWALDSTVGEETISVLCWAIDQPEKRISSENINLLIDRGNDVNVKSKTNITPVMLSIRNRRFDILNKLIDKGAKVTDVGNDGFTPLAMASSLGSAEAMAKLLEAGAEVDDGSLHDAARELRVENMRVLIKFGHEPDYPSDRHDGRSALAELCLNGNYSGKNLELEEVISCLIANGADMKLRCGRKSIFHYALDSLDPLPILAVLLKLLWKMINDDCYLYDDGKYTYSLTKYVEKHLLQGPQAQTDEILKLLRNKRATDRFWANSIDDQQPPDMVGAPQHIMEEVQHQRLREKRKSELKMDMLHSMEMKRLAAIEEDRILGAQNQTAIQRQIEASRAQLSLQEKEADQTLRLSTRAETERQRLLGVRHAAELQHTRDIGKEQVQIQAALSRSQIATAKAIEEGKIEAERTAQMLQIEFVAARSAKENEGVKARMMIENDGVRTRTVIENDALAEKERIGKRMHEREMARLAAQKRLLEGAAVAAPGRMSAGQIGGRQPMGYIMGEIPNTPR